jgi:hypothetical protein
MLKPHCSTHFARFPLARARSEHRLIACAPSGFESRYSLDIAESNSAGRTDLEVYVPASAHNSAQYFDSFPDHVHAQADLVLEFVPDCKLVNANHR